MRKIVILGMLIMSVGVIRAQWVISPEAGVTAVNRSQAGDGQWDAGWKLGVAVQYDFSSLFSLKSGLHYTQRGYELGNLPWADNEGEFHISDGDNTRHFLQLPLMAQLGFGLSDNIRVNIAAGPYIGYCISHSYSYGTYTFYPTGGIEGSPGYGYGYAYGGSGVSYGPFDPFSDTRRFDWGASFSAGLEGKKLYFNVGYDLSLGKEHKYGDIEANYHTLSLSVGYKFKLSK